MKYWKQGFYDEPIEGSIEITEEYYNQLLVGQSAGLFIAESKKGYPILVVHGTGYDKRSTCLINKD